MVRWVFIAIVFIFLNLPNFAFAAKGVVVIIPEFCDYFVVKSSDGSYAVLEWYGGSIPYKGDILIGNYESYGFKTLYNLTRKLEIRVWVDDYWLSSDEAIERVYENCY